MPGSDDGHPQRRKLALVIGNDNYTRRESKLTHCRQNANSLGKSLKDIHFTVEHGYDIKEHDDMVKCIRKFVDGIGDGDFVLFYFSGHGCEINGKNYLIPTDDGEIRTCRDIEDFAVDLERILERLYRKDPSSVTIVILDCYKPYPLGNGSITNGKTWILFDLALFHLKI